MNEPLLKSNDNTGLLVIIAVLLMGVLGVLAYQMGRDDPEQRLADSLSNTIEDIGNSVADSRED